MFRRKRFSEPAASIPWWPTEDPNRPEGNSGAHGGPGGFGPGGAPPLAAHDPFGGWPAFGDGYSDGYPDRFAGTGTSMDGMSGQGHPANGWPLVEGYGGAVDPFAAPASHQPNGHPTTHPSNGHPSAPPTTSGHPNGHLPNGYPANGHPANGYPSGAYPAVGHPGYAASARPPASYPASGHPAEPFPVNGQSAVDAAAAAGHPGAVHPGAPGEAGIPSANVSEGVPDWIPLLTHPIGGQRFQPDLEAAPDPTERPAPGRPPRRRNGRRPKARRQQGAPIDGSEANPTTWIPTVDVAGPPPSSPTSNEPAHSTPDAPLKGERARSFDPAPSPLVMGGAPGPSARPVPVPLAAPDPAEASSLAGAFAADYLSWDQDNPARRGQVLAQYLPADVTGDPSRLGWSGKGRQRSEFSLPGAVHPDGDGRVLVDVRVRVTPFRQVGPADRAPAPGPEAQLEVAGVPAVAPAPSARGWKSQDSHWVRLTVPVTRDQGRLVVDTWDEQLGEDSGASEEAADRDEVDARDADDPGTADDADDAAGPTREPEEA